MRDGVRGGVRGSVERWGERWGERWCGEVVWRDGVRGYV